jgi:serine phosphatase RsbU (regulator of sigma subunit)
LVEESSSVGDVGTPAFADRWQLAMEAGGVAAWESDPDTGELWWSPRSHEVVVGIGSASLPATLSELFELIHPDDRADARGCLELARHGHRSQRVQVRLEVAGLHAKWIDLSAMAVLDERGAPVSMVGTVMDVTERAETALARERMLHEERRARSEAEAAKERMQFLIRAAHEVRAVLDPAVVRRTAADLAAQHLGEWSLILDPSGRVVEAAAGSDLSSAASASGTLVLAASSEVIDRVAATGDAQLSTSPVTLVLGGDDPSVSHLVEASSIMAAPLALGSNAVGIIVTGHGKAGRPYRAEELELFGQYADSVAATVVKATLFQERSATARVLQQSLLPASLPAIDGIEIGTAYVPVGEGVIVGGDFYDVFRVSDGRYAFAIGDVSGKGSEAAAVTSLVRHSIRAFAEIHEEPADALAAVNDHVRTQGPSSRYCTATLGVLDLGDEVQAILAVAGHPLPLVLRADGTVEGAGVPGTLLGMFRDVTVAPHAVRLDPGDAIILYTDGVVEARSADVPFGEERLKALVKTMSADGASRIAAGIGAAVAEYRDVQDDDLAVLVIRRTPG